MHRLGLLLNALLVACCLAPTVRASEWPQWRGLERDAHSPDTGLLKDWTTTSPTRLWQMRGLGLGYSSVAIVGGRLFTTGDLRDDDRSLEQFVLALDLRSGETLWKVRVGGPWSRDGAHCTPTVSDGLVYAIGTGGGLVCVEAATGKTRWRKDLVVDFYGGMMTGFGYSESPLVDGDRLVCTPGGADAMVVALNRKTGDVIWKCAVPKLGRWGRNGAGYSSMVVTEVGGVRMYVQLVGRGLVGIAAKDGRFLWGYNKLADSRSNIPTPIVQGEHVFGINGRTAGCALLKLVPDDGGVKAQEVYCLSSSIFQNEHGGVVLVGDFVYGAHGVNPGIPTCVELKTGKVMWKGSPPGRGSAAVVYADGNLYFSYEDGVVALVEATPEAYRLKGQLTAGGRERSPRWAHPVICDGKLYLRHGDGLVCYDLKAK